MTTGILSAKFPRLLRLAEGLRGSPGDGGCAIRAHRVCRCAYRDAGRQRTQRTPTVVSAGARGLLERRHRNRQRAVQKLTWWRRRSARARAARRRLWGARGEWRVQLLAAGADGGL